MLRRITTILAPILITVKGKYTFVLPSLVFSDMAMQVQTITWTATTIEALIMTGTNDIIFMFLYC